MVNETLDILMGKFLDGEITPEEQRMLDQCLAEDKAAREEFNSFLRLHQQTRSAVGQLLDNGRPMDDIFEAAWQTASPAHRWQNRFFRCEWFLTAAGLAAGLLLGFVLHGMIVAPDDSVPPVPSPLVQSPSNTASVTTTSPAPLRIPGEHRNVDWYTVTEPSGEQWLVEGYRRQQVTPAIYYGDL